MKYLILIVAAVIAVFCCFALAGCCDEGSEPPAPLPNPDDVTRYSGSDGYESITYTYYCYNGTYLAYTYIRPEKCTEYHLESRFETDGICY